MSRPLLSADEVATLLGISRRTVCRFIATGKLPYVQVGRQCRIHPDAYEAYVRENTRHVEPVEAPFPNLKGTRYHQPVELGGDRYVQ